MAGEVLAYRVSTGLLTLMMVGGPAMYFLDYETVSATFSRLGYPTFLVYPLAIAKLFGLVAVLTRKSETLKNLAYAGFFYDFILAITAHLMAGDGEFVPATVALVAVTASYYFGEKVNSASPA